MKGTDIMSERQIPPKKKKHTHSELDLLVEIKTFLGIILTIPDNLVEIEPIMVEFLAVQKRQSIGEL